MIMFYSCRDEVEQKLSKEIKSGSYLQFLIPFHPLIQQQGEWHKFDSYFASLHTLLSDSKNVQNTFFGLSSERLHNEGSQLSLRQCV